MTKIKEQAAEIPQDIPEEKVTSVIEILKALRALFGQSGESVLTSEATTDSVTGIGRKYATPDLILLEKEACGEAARERHAVRLDIRFVSSTVFN
ncbi:MAG: hypothetical protein FWH51_05930 [Dehalococcoidia bacterium]|nr:hypothetical protein [Dehalococcoidia bacterium]